MRGWGKGVTKSFERLREWERSRGVTKIEQVQTRGEGESKFLSFFDNVNKAASVKNNFWSFRKSSVNARIFFNINISKIPTTDF